MKSLFLFLVFIVIGAGITIAFLSQTAKTRVTQPKKEAVPLSTKFSLKDAPSQTLRGTVLSLTGEVLWQSRIASEPASIATLSSVQQGEELVTSESGEFTVQFLKTCTIKMSQYTHLNFAQTLPSAIVLQQRKGVVSITNACTTPLSVRALHLLIQINQGESTISVDEEENIITIDVLTGDVTVAYNDDENVSTVLNLKNGETLTFDDTTRTAEIN